jgi:cell wall assembly regulator SMI1
MREEDVLMDEGKTNPVLLSQFEESLNIRFPIDYKALIQEHNALYPIRNHFKFNNKYYNELWSYRLEDDGTDSRDVVFLGYGENLSESSRIDLAQGFDVYGHDYVIAIGTAANGDHICFDYRHDPKTNEPHVVVMFHDAYDEDGKMAICHVTDTFEEFMNSLY